MAKPIKKDGVYDKRVEAGRQAAGKDRKKKATVREMNKKLKNNKRHGKQI
jgi:hypothetical protein